MASSEGLARRVKALITLRVLFVTVLLGTYLFFEIGHTTSPYPSVVLYVIIALYASSIAYALTHGRVPDVTSAYAQLVLDMFAAAALIMATGGIESWFSWLLLIIVLAAATVLGRRAAYVIATVGGITYGVLMDLQFYNVLPVPYMTLFPDRDFLYRVLSHIAGMYLMAFLAGHLVARLESKGVDYEELATFNRAVIESTPAGIFTADTDGLIVLFNRAAESITGISREAAIGAPAGGLFPFLEGAPLAPSPRFEAVIRAGGEERVIGMALSKITDIRGQETGCIGVFEDLTELKRLGAEIKRKEGLAAVGELTAKIAHEIRNPLASLKNSIEMLQEGSVTPEKKARLMSIALDEMDRLNATLTDFLNYAKPKALDLKRDDVHRALDEVMEMLRNRSGVPVRMVKDFGGEMFAVVDINRMKEVFWNLGINALEAMPHGGELKVSTARRAGSVVINFTDTGGGISPDNHVRIFYPFFTTKGYGTGLGLSTANRVVEDHGGKLSVSSVPGKGATFTITLPEAAG